MHIVVLYAYFDRIFLCFCWCFILLMWWFLCVCLELFFDCLFMFMLFMLAFGLVFLCMCWCWACRFCVFIDYCLWWFCFRFVGLYLVCFVWLVMLVRCGSVCHWLLNCLCLWIGFVVYDYGLVMRFWGVCVAW